MLDVYAWVIGQCFWCKMIALFWKLIALLREDDGCILEDDRAVFQNYGSILEDDSVDLEIDNICHLEKQSSYFYIFIDLNITNS